MLEFAMISQKTVVESKAGSFVMLLGRMRSLSESLSGERYVICTILDRTMLQSLLVMDFSCEGLSQFWSWFESCKRRGFHEGSIFLARGRCDNYNVQLRFLISGSYVLCYFQRPRDVFLSEGWMCCGNWIETTGGFRKADAESAYRKGVFVSRLYSSLLLLVLFFLCLRIRVVNCDVTLRSPSRIGIIIISRRCWQLSVRSLECDKTKIMLWNARRYVP